jgi:hypothetical protein
MYATPLGATNDPWAVLTADVEESTAFSRTQIELLERFGQLVTTGAQIAAGSAAPPGDEASDTAAADQE